MREANRRAITGTITLVLTLLGWSSVPLFLRHFAGLIDAWTSNGWRYGFSALCWAPLLAFIHLRGGLPRGLWRAALMPSFFNAAGQVAFCLGLYEIEAGLFTFGLRTQLVFSAVGAYLLFPRERRVIRSRWYLAGAAAVLCGTSLAVLGGGLAGGGDKLAGIALSIASGALFAGYALAVRRNMTEFNPVIAFAAISQLTTVPLVALMLWLGDRSGAAALHLPAGETALLLLSALIGIALGHVLYYVSIARLGVAISSGVLQLHPFIVALGSLAIFGEELWSLQWIGGAVALAGAVMMVAVQGRLHAPQAAPAIMAASSPCASD